MVEFTKSPISILILSAGDHQDEERAYGWHVHQDQEV
jgi:hypothetical protein